MNNILNTNSLISDFNISYNTFNSSSIAWRKSSLPITPFKRASKLNLTASKISFLFISYLFNNIFNP